MSWQLELALWFALALTLMAFAVWVNDFATKQTVKR